MWKVIGLIGRDRLLSREILPRIRGRKAPFIIVGPRGIGKSAILEWAYKNAEGKKAYVSANSAMREIFIKIVKDWNLTITDEGKELNPDRARMTILEQAINRETEGKIFIDEIQSATPSLLRRLRLWRERFQVYAAGVPPFRKEELKRGLWGLKTIELHELKGSDRQRLAEEMCRAVGSSESPAEIARQSGGKPGRMVAMARGEVEENPERVEGEEMDFSPILLLGICGIVAFRLIGRALDETDMYILGGLGMGAITFFRFFLMKGMGGR